MSFLQTETGLCESVYHFSIIFLSSHHGLNFQVRRSGKNVIENYSQLNPPDDVLRNVNFLPILILSS